LNTARLLANSVYSKEISRTYNAEPGGKFKKAVASGKGGMLNFKNKKNQRQECKALQPMLLHKPGIDRPHHAKLQTHHAKLQRNDLDVWKSELSEFIFSRIINMDICCICF
jgi:hypothetical protein